MELKERLKLARKYAQLTQTQVASAVGMTQATYSQLERGIIKSTSKIVEIANLLKVNSTWLATGQGEMTASYYSTQQENTDYKPNTSTIEFMNTLKEMEKNGELTPQVIGLLNNTLSTVKSISGQRLNVTHLVETSE